MRSHRNTVKKSSAGLQTLRRRQAASLSRRELRQRNFKSKRRALLDTASPPTVGSLSNALALLGQHSVDDTTAVLDALRLLRSLLSASDSEVDLDAVVASGVIPFLVSLLQHPSHDALRVDACWCIANIAAGEAQHVAAVLSTADVMVSIVHRSGSGSVNPALVEAAVWCIGNLAAEPDAARTILMRSSALESIVRIVQDPTASIATAKMAAWSLSNFTRAARSATHCAAGCPSDEIRVFCASNVAAAVVELLQRALAMSTAPSTSIETRRECVRLSSEVAWALMFLEGMNAPEISCQIHRPETLAVFTSLLLHTHEICGETVSEQASLLIPILRCIGHAINNSRSLIVTQHGEEFVEFAAALAATPGLLSRFHSLVSLGTPSVVNGIIAAGGVACSGGGLSSLGAHRWLAMDATWIIGLLATPERDREEEEEKKRSSAVLEAIARESFLPLLSHLLVEASFDISRRAAFALRDILCASKNTSPGSIALAVVHTVVRCGTVPAFLRYVLFFCFIAY